MCELRSFCNGTQGRREGEAGSAGSGADRGSGYFEVTAQARAQRPSLEELGTLDTDNQDWKAFREEKQVTKNKKKHRKVCPSLSSFYSFS